MKSVVFLVSMVLLGWTAAAETKVTENLATIPVPELEKNGYGWQARHERICSEAPKMKPEVVLLGDSITHFWAGANSIGGEDAAPLFKHLFRGYRVLNAGFGWDRTQNVLWRIDHGELDGLDPKVVVLMIGTNNIDDGTRTNLHARANTADETAEGVLAVVDRIRAKLPNTHLVVMGILPRGQSPNGHWRRVAPIANSRVAEALRGRDGVTFLDLSERFLGENGDARVWYYCNDFIHLSDEGYRLWFDALQPLLARYAGHRPNDFEKLEYGTDGTCDLKVGLWCWPMPMDYDGDGIVDLVVACPGDPSHGTYFFRNPGGTFPVFERPIRIAPVGPWNVSGQKIAGEQVVVKDGRLFRDFLRCGFEKGERFQSVAPDFWRAKWKYVRNCCWRLVDFDGDGALDILIGLDDWGNYGWADAYDEKGKWKNGPLHGRVLVAKCRRSADDVTKADYAEPVPITCADGTPLETFGQPMPMFADFDGDGDGDLVCGSFRDELMYFENIGTVKAPRFARGRPLVSRDGAEVRGELCMIEPTAYDWNRDGLPDIICGEEDGRVFFIENLGKGMDGVLRFAPPRFFRQRCDKVGVGALATPFAVDWDGDGDEDIVCGDSAGFLSVVENLSGCGVATPKWAEPVRLSAGGRAIRIQAGENGSIQGPAEAKWGYSVCSVADWDGDGFKDVMVNSVLGDVVWYRNPGKAGARELEPARPVEVEWGMKGQPALAWGWRKPNGKALLTQWRTTPLMTDWNKDGLVDLVMLDHEGYLCLYRRFRDTSESLRLSAPERVFCWEDGKPMRLNPNRAGGSGRRKFCFADWDGDGKPDLIVNGVNANLHRQTMARDGKWFFSPKAEELGIRKLAGHTTCPTACDFDANGICDLVVGAEDGFLYYLKNSR